MYISNFVYYLMIILLALISISKILTKRESFKSKKSSNYFEMKLLDVDKQYFSFDKKIIDQYLNSTSWGYLKQFNKTVLKCKANNIYIGKVKVWRSNHKSLKGSAYGKLKDINSNYMFDKDI